MIDPEIDIQRYRTVDGRVPFSEWIAGLNGGVAARILIYKDRLGWGQWGNSRCVDQGVWELKIKFGPGYRIYYVLAGRTVVVLLCGGDKGSQARDVRRARAFAADYWRRI